MLAIRIVVRIVDARRQFDRAVRILENNESFDLRSTLVLETEWVPRDAIVLGATMLLAALREHAGVGCAL